MFGFRNLECLIVVMFVYYFLGACENWFVHCLLNRCLTLTVLVLF